MARITREDGHLIVAAIRVLAHRLQGPPAPARIAELLDIPPEAVGLRLVALEEEGIVRHVRSAYEDHVEVADHARLDELESGAADGAMDEALAEFDRRKQAEAERMSRLFEEGEHEQRRRRKLAEMDEGLFRFERDRPRNPFGDDDDGDRRD